MFTIKDTQTTRKVLEQKVTITLPTGKDILVGTNIVREEDGSIEYSYNIYLGFEDIIEEMLEENQEDLIDFLDKNYGSRN